MRILLFSTLTAFLFITSSAHAQDTWIQKDSVNGPPRSSCASFVLNGEGYILGGLDQIEFKRKMYSYDTDQNDWDNEESIGGVNGAGLNRGSAVSFAINDKGYVGLGQGNAAPFYSDLWEYNPINKSWSQKADFIGSPRRQAVFFSIDSIAYVGTGQDPNGFTNDFYKYEPAINTWTQLNDFPGAPRKGAAGFSMGAQGYVAAGDTGVYVNDFWQYKPATDSWIQKADFPGSPRTGASGWGIFPTAFVACGYDNNLSYTKDVWEYNYFGNVWQQRADFTGPERTNASSFVINGIAYLGLGYNGEFLDDFYAYTPILSVSPSVENQISSPYPNPSSGQILIPLNQNQSELATCRFYDLNGRDITSIVKLTQSQKGLKADLSDLPKGTYICTYQTNHTAEW